MNFEIVKEVACPFGDWENGGSSFLLKKRESWALNKIDHEIYSKYFLGKTNGVFLEAGANDGITQSNTMFFEHYKGWTGILVEPVRQQYGKILHPEYSNRSQLNVAVNAALVGDLYGHDNIEMVYTPGCNGLLSVVNNEKAEAMLARDKYGDKIPVQVPALSLNKILAAYWEQDIAIDLMVLDVEGYEAEALKGIDFTRWKINYLLVEQLNGPDSEIEALVLPYYDLVEVIGEHDYMYKKK
jgi:FkbM family methyltransferase